MPRGNGTGPMGMGRMTGRGAGLCAGFAAPGSAYANGLAGGFGCGFGRGCGYRRMFHATGMPGWARRGYPGTNEPAFEEKAFLTGQVEFLENQLQQIKKRLSSLNEEAE